MPNPKRQPKRPATVSNETQRSPNKQKIIDQFYDTADAMALLKCSANTLYNWRRKGILPYVVMARKIYYLEEDLLKMIQRFRRIGIPGKKRRA